MAAGAEVVATAAGSVQGLRSDGMRIWRAIPFARPPVGELRHRPPLPPEVWSGVLDATEGPARAWQADPPVPGPNDTGSINDVPPPCSEDCLYLNVTAPEEPPPPGGYPVLVWLHGGGFVRGWSNQLPVAEGATFVRRGVVVVSVNYRLGAFGFLALEDLLGPGEADSANAGLLDQIAALRWIHTNIAAFGGDPRQVTVYGVSAGGKSVTDVLGSPLTSGLIARAICSSGGEYVATPAQAASLRRRVLAVLGLSEDHAEKIRDVPAPDLLAAQESLVTAEGTGTWLFRPSVGGSALPTGPLDAIARGAARGVPLLIGNNGNEGFTFALRSSNIDGDVRRVLGEAFGEAEATAMLEGYAAAYPGLDGDTVAVRVLGDERYGVATHHLANAQAAHAPVWRYRMDSSPPGAPAEANGSHGLDGHMAWLADTYRGIDDPRTALSLAMADAWASFARTGEPGPVEGAGEWDRYTPEEQETMILDTPPHVEHAPRGDILALWEGRTWQPTPFWQIEGIS